MPLARLMRDVCQAAKVRFGVVAAWLFASEWLRAWSNRIEEAAEDVHPDAVVCPDDTVLVEGAGGVGGVSVSTDDLISLPPRKLVVAVSFSSLMCIRSSVHVSAFGIQGVNAQATVVAVRGGSVGDGSVPKAPHCAEYASPTHVCCQMREEEQTFHIHSRGGCEMSGVLALLEARIWDSQERSTGL
jgi:hypothetical protein